MPETLDVDLAGDLRLQIRDLEKRLEDLETERILEVTRAVRMLEYLKADSGRWHTNNELRDLVGNGYQNARASLLVLGLVEVRKDKPTGDGRGARRTLTRYTAGGTVGRISRKRIMEAVTYGADSDSLA